MASGFHEHPHSQFPHYVHSACAPIQACDPISSGDELAVPSRAQVFPYCAYAPFSPSTLFGLVHFVPDEAIGYDTPQRTLQALEARRNKEASHQLVQHTLRLELARSLKVSVCGAMCNALGILLATYAWITPANPNGSDYVEANMWGSNYDLGKQN